eukprot:scaffold8079_cov121-Cylindrotheca_fusiformis.AAC.7
MCKSFKNSATRPVRFRSSSISIARPRGTSVMSRLCARYRRGLKENHVYCIPRRALDVVVYALLLN